MGAASSSPYKGHRYPAEIISHCVWLYYRFPLLATSRRDAKAATRFFRQLLRGLRSVPRVMVTDKLASYGVAHRRLMRSVEHRLRHRLR